MASPYLAALLGQVPGGIPSRDALASELMASGYLAPTAGGMQVPGAPMGAAPPMTSMPMAVAPPLAGPGQIPAPAPAAAQEEVDPLEAFRQSVRDRTARRREEERQAILNPPPPMPVGQAARQAFTGGEATNVVEDLQNRQNAIQRILNWLRGD